MTTKSQSKAVVGIADMKIAQAGQELVTYALGSCLGICLYDPIAKIAAMVHIMLPLNMEAGRKTPFKYADTGVRETLKALEAKGAKRIRIVAKAAGGAKMFEISGGAGLGNIGQRNVESLRMVLKAERIRLLGEDFGGNSARTLSFNPATGNGLVRSYGKPDLVI